MGFEPTISAGERAQTHALDRAATGTGNDSLVTVTTSKFKEKSAVLPILCLSYFKDITSKTLPLSRRCFSMFEKGVLNEMIEPKGA